MRVGAFLGLAVGLLAIVWWVERAVEGGTTVSGRVVVGDATYRRLEESDRMLRGVSGAEVTATNRSGESIVTVTDLGGWFSLGSISWRGSAEDSLRVAHPAFREFFLSEVGGAGEIARGGSVLISIVPRDRSQQPLPPIAKPPSD